MSIELNHIIVKVRDKRRSAAFLADLLGLEVGRQWGPFIPVQTGNGVTLDFWDNDPAEVVEQHYAFLVSEAEFDAIMGRIEQAGVTYYADPERRQAGRINRNDGGRGAYFLDPSGHNMEIITRPYGSGG
ncbi:VOC family protein [Longispora sp. NPDC051575]|uniref:VOC family protein n=1 Tax=Longispora sp. NPDC051575 TaxID=3154943 RepID=UPI003413D1F8